MKSENYIKTMLTVIACCLIILTLQTVNLVPQLNASGNNSFGNYTLVPVNEDGSINVRIISSSDVIDVNIDDVDRYAFRYCTIPVEITNEPIQVEEN